MSFRIAHLSDVHLGPMPVVSIRDLLSKRAIGFLNWHKNRGRSFRSSVTDQLVGDIKAKKPNHIVVTGDLVNIGLDAEYGRARTFLEQLGDPADVSAIPGNHDAYVQGALGQFNANCGDFFEGDQPDKEVGQPYPFGRYRGPVCVIGISSAVATAPFMATGFVDRRQRRALQRLLAQAEGHFRVVLVHHPPFPKATHWHKRLINEAQLREDIFDGGAELVLHGHTHLPTQTTISSRSGPVPVFGVSSAAQAPGGHKPAAAYTLFTIARSTDGWLLSFERRGYADRSDTIDTLERGEVAISRKLT
ncbi:MAG: metallophosphoesterase [Pseudomonadota bacterium]